MNRKKLLVFFFLLPLIAIAQKTTLKGKAPDYAGRVISFYTFSDPVIHQKKELAQGLIARDGSFTLSFENKQTIEIYADLEKYTGTVVIEPAKDYTVTLPPFALRNGIEAKSPYFQPTLYWLGLPEANKNNLNFLIRSFITDYNEELVKNTAAFYKNLSKETAAELIKRLEQKYSGSKNEYFNTLKKYIYADLENSVNPDKPELIIDQYFKKEPVKLTNPAYQKIFMFLFNDYLRKQTLDIQNMAIFPLVNSGNFLGLVSWFEKKGFRRETAELVVLKGLYDGYYTGGFRKERIIKAIDQSRKGISSEFLPLVEQIQEKLTKLSVNGKAPDFSLENSKKEQVTLDKYKSKFVYLSFIRSNSSECRAELDSLKSLERKFRQVLAVVTISTDEDFGKATGLWKIKGYPWELLNGSAQKHVIDNYNAQVVPVFYLIDPQGNLVLSPAPPPTHEFEPIFLKLFRDYRFKRQ